MIFFGNHLAEKQVAELKTRVDEGLDILGGLQQPDHPTSEADAAECREWRKEMNSKLYDIVSKIVDAFGYKLESLNEYEEQLRP